ncbi:MAG: hypothetical protein HY367_01105 [Candidatus Aenigmarchaeota archaeon]|nr:hypothetical protein [Candidatus Aenigmarchaeota archaeon]
MLKGQEEIPITLAVVIFAGTLTALFILISALSSLSVKAGNVQEDVDAVDLAHLYEKCLAKGGIVDVGSLEGIRFLHSHCNLHPSSVEIKDLETGKTMSFGVSGGEIRAGKEHGIFVSIKAGDEIHPAELTVKSAPRGGPDVKI